MAKALFLRLAQMSFSLAHFIICAAGLLGFSFAHFMLLLCRKQFHLRKWIFWAKSAQMVRK
jgi:hypothetical protein